MEGRSVSENHWLACIRRRGLCAARHFDGLAVDFGKILKDSISMRYCYFPHFRQSQFSLYNSARSSIPNRLSSGNSIPWFSLSALILFSSTLNAHWWFPFASLSAFSSRCDYRLFPSPFSPLRAWNPIYPVLTGFQTECLINSTVTNSFDFVESASQEALPGASSSFECSAPLISCIPCNDVNFVLVPASLGISKILFSPSISYAIPVLLNSCFLRSSSSSSAFWSR